MQDKTNKTAKIARALIVIIALGLIVTGYFYLKNRSASLGPPLSKLPPQTIKSLYVGKIPVSLEISEREVNKLPQKLSVYKLSNLQLSEDKIIEIAADLGLTQAPIKTKDPIFGETYTFSSSTGYLRVESRNRILDYKTGQALLGNFTKIPDSEGSKAVALNYLLTKKIITSENEIALYDAKPLFISEGGHVDKDKSDQSPNAYSVTFVNKINSYPVLTDIYETGAVNVLFNNKYEVVSVYVNSITDVVELGNYPLKGFSEIKSSLGLASLQSIDNGNTDLLEFSPDQITKATINTIELAYFKETVSSNSLLRPVYLLKGTAQLKSRESAKVDFLLPAVSTANQLTN